MVSSKRNIRTSTDLMQIPDEDDGRHFSLADICCNILLAEWSYKLQVIDPGIFDLFFYPLEHFFINPLVQFKLYLNTISHCRIKAHPIFFQCPNQGRYLHFLIIEFDMLCIQQCHFRFRCVNLF